MFDIHIMLNYNNNEILLTEAPKFQKENEVPINIWKKKSNV